MVTAWLITLPAAGVVGALMWYVGHAIGGLAGSVVVVAILVGLAIWMWRRSRRQPVNAEKVNEAWEPAESERVLEVVR
jgi:inorganic phosphate transporter, PiT family